jgi:hypothetical protein
MGQMTTAYVYAAFFFTYGIKVVGASRDFLLTPTTIAPVSRETRLVIDKVAQKGDLSSKAAGNPANVG